MKYILHPLMILIPVLVLPACAQLTGAFGRAGSDGREPAAMARAADADTPRPAARPGDTAVDGDVQAGTAVTVAGPGGVLGETLASLGAPSEPGLWLRTGLVTQTTPGRVEAPGGASAQVELRPSGGAAGAGSQLSLDGFRALGVPLTQLVRLRVIAR
ncbi:D-galactarate dehydratase [Roseinatronobacter alkalisoli]|uniref:D-galactarate dehydratase n=1 Tax=Roseinatronobacter alkalisoli TaxID=3028235 RepID=A0ABT5T867_9RHOB|nr:D-galactarate dehydratase [Roseinatronobacter sp. HJB301]MDD7971323.1 D-galactarate dehydratase [Roseinatronobacter sp. HJB301]